MNVTHKIKTMYQSVSETVLFIVACGQEIYCVEEGKEEYKKTSVDWEDVTCKSCLKRKLK